VRPLILRIGLLLMGIGLLGGAVGTVLVSSFKAIDEQVGTNGSAAAAVLGIGLIIAAFNPSGSVAWVRAGILYGLVVLVFEVANVVVAHKPFHLGPVIFGLAFTLLLIAAYPERRKLLSDTLPPKPSKPADEPPPALETAEPEKAS
jgi:peptidoglycan/LPS O-acetylase OafA/YrhL